MATKKPQSGTSQRTPNPRDYRNKSVPLTSDLREAHPSLYRRLTDLVWLKVGMGLALIFSPPVPTPNVNSANLVSLASLDVWGSIFVITGLALLLSTRRAENTYKWTRQVLLFSIAYDLLWLASLFVSVLVGGLRSGPVTVLWAYFTLNVYRLVSDSGWETVAFLKRVRDNDGTG